MGTEKRERNGYEWRQAQAGNGNDWLSGMMFCYNMPEPAAEDCPEAETWAADRTYAEALMRCYNE